MSAIDCHPHKPIASFLDHPLYLAKGSFDYEGFSVTPNDVVWRDDCNASPAIINLRACIALTLYFSALESEDRAVNLRTGWGEVKVDDIYHSLNTFWKEVPTYGLAHELFEKYLKLVSEEDVGNFNIWAMEQLGLLMIRLHPEFLTAKELSEATELKLTQNEDFPLGMEAYIMFNWPQPDINGWMELDFDYCVAKIYPLNGVYEWEISSGDKVLDAGQRTKILECKLEAEMFIHNMNKVS